MFFYFVNFEIIIIIIYMLNMIYQNLRACFVTSLCLNIYRSIFNFYFKN